MQTTLLGIAIALILALVTALVGPLFINWNDHRAFFEAEASHLLGLPVRVAGAIDARVLPTPSVTLRGIEIGRPGEDSRLRAAALGIALGLGPLMRGQVRAVEMRLFGPELRLGLDRAGGLDWPGLAMGLDRETLSIERLSIEEGRAILTDAASGAHLALDKLSFNGEVRSLIGPVRGEGSFVISGGRYGYRISTGRFGENGLKLKLGIDNSERPLTVEADGVLAFEQGALRFDGNLALARPVGAVLASGKAVINEPWRASGKVRATFAAALFEQVEFQYGPEERAVKLNGAAEIKFGEQPRLQAVLSARHVDLDRLIATPNMMRRLPFAAVKTFAEMFGGILRPALPTQLAISVDAVTLGGATLQAIGADLSTQGEAWLIEKLDFRAPGFTQLSASGRLDPTAKGFSFAGMVKVDAGDSTAMLTWLTGRSSPSGGPIKAWRASGKVTLASDRIAVEQLKTRFDRATLEGRLSYAWSSGDRPARLEVDLSADELDIDAAQSFAGTAFAGLEWETPREVTLALEFGRVRIAGIEARKATARLKLDANGLDLQRLSLEGVSGAAFKASGRIDTRSSSPRGKITIDLDASDLGAVYTLAEKFAPPVVEPLRRLTGRQPSAKLRAILGMEGAGPGLAIASTTAKLAVEGDIGSARLRVTVGATGDRETFSLADLRSLKATDVSLEAQLDTDEGAVLLALLGLDHITVADKQPGHLTLAIAGRLNRDLRIDGKLAAGPIEINGKGSARMFGDQPTTAKFDQIFGTIGGSKVQGQLALTFGAPVRVEGAIEAESLDLPAAVSSLIGMPVQRIRTGERGRETWSLEPFTPSTSNVAGRIEIKATRAVLSARLVAQWLRGVLRFEESRMAFEEFEGELAGGRVAGLFALVRSPEGLSASARIALTGAEIAALIPAEERPPITGHLAFQATVEGAGLSPAAFIGSLRGSGTITLEQTQIAGLNPHVFDALIRTVDFGIQTDTKQIKQFVTTMFDNSYLAVTRAHGAIAIAAGQIRLIEPRVRADGADLAVAANVDLAHATLDATLTLSGTPAIGVAGRPVVSVALKGPLAAPRYTVNTDALARWLTLRSVEQQSKRLDAIEATRRATTIQPPATLPALTAIPATPLVRPAKEADVNSPQTQASPEASPDAEETTGEIPAANQVPPLPPPITIQPATKRLERARAPSRAGNAPLQ